MFKVLAIIGVVGLILGLVYLGVFSKKVVNSPVAVSTQNIVQNSASIKYEVKVAYPQVAGVINSAAQSKINSDLASRMQNNVSGFYSEVNTNEQALYSNPNASKFVLNAINTFDIVYNISQANNKMVSFSFNVSDYQAGMAHPNVYNQVYNFNVFENREIQLADLFKPNSNYLQILSELSAQDLKNQLPPDQYFPEMVNPGTVPDAKNFDLFNLDPQNLIIIFDPYQVAAGVNGTLKVSIPLLSLKSILNPQYLP